MHPGLSRPPACREGPGRVLAAPAVRSSQAQVHVTNFDYNHHPLNTMPGTRPASHARRRAQHQAIHATRHPAAREALRAWGPAKTACVP
jgi:4'-phosphopantetheinyl transferase EntD